MNDYSPLINFTKNNFFEYPFPHIVIENAISKKKYEELSLSFPNPHENLNAYDNTIFTAPDNYIFENQSVNQIWKEFLKYLSSKDYYNEILDVLGDKLISKYPEEFKNIKNLKQLSVNTTREKKNINEIIAYGRIMYYSVVQNQGIPKKLDGSELQIHCDGANKLFTTLIYFKDKNDNSSGGDLALYKWRFKIPLFLKKLILARSLNPINSIIRKFQFLFIQKYKVVKYNANTLVLFLGSEDSLHSVEERVRNSPIRKSVHAGIHYSKRLWDGQSIIDKIFFRLKKHYARKKI